MKMVFLPGKLELFTDGDGFTCVTLRGEFMGRFRSQKEGICKFNELRSSLEVDHPEREMTVEEKRNAMVQEIGDSLTTHNSLRNAGPKKRTGTRTFG